MLRGGMVGIGRVYEMQCWIRKLRLFWKMVQLLGFMYDCACAVHSVTRETACIDFT